MFVREMICFSERKGNFLMFRSGKRVVFRMELIDWGGMRLDKPSHNFTLKKNVGKNTNTNHFYAS